MSTPTPRNRVPGADHPQDTCECGDYRRDHAGGTGRCIFTPDLDQTDRDGHFGAGPCHKFKLAYRYPAPTEIAASSHDIRQAGES